MGTPPPSTPSPSARHPSQATYPGTQRHAPPPWQPHTVLEQRRKNRLLQQTFTVHA